MKENISFIQKSGYVIINIFSSIIVFSRSVFFLKFLPDKDLGYLILLQAVMGLFGLLQIGLFNGGLRIFSIDSYKEKYKDVNNNITTFVIAITFLVLIGGLFKYYNGGNKMFIFFIASILGGVSLLRNWFSNLLIARKKYKIINQITFISSVISALLSLMIFKIGLLGAIISIGSLPISYIILFVFFDNENRPTTLNINFKVLKEILIYGFIPYLSGIALILYNQIDKVLIANVLSVEELGKFYLATVFIRVFSLVPVNINNLLVPNAINHYKNYNLKATYKIFYEYLSILIIYSLIVWLLLVLFGKPVVNIVFPQKIDQLQYLFILLPGMIATTISGAFGFLLYLSLHYKAILWNNIFSLISYLAILGLMFRFNIFTLVNVSYAKSIQGILVFLFLLFVLIISLKRINSFYYLNKLEKKYNIT